MQISVTGRHVQLTDALRDYAAGKLEHAMTEFPRIESVHAILGVEKYRQWAELVIQGANHTRVDAREESEDMYASIDGALHKAVRQLRKLRDKMVDHKPREPLAEVEKVLRAGEPNKP